MNTFNGVDNLGLVYSTVPLVDPKTGVISRPWWQFFVNLYNRVGGPNAPSNDQLAAMIGNNSYFMLSEDMNQEEPFFVPMSSSSSSGPVIQTGIPVSVNFNEEPQEDVASTALSVMNFNAQNAQTLQNATWASPLGIGNTAANSGAFTTLSASSTVSGAGFSTYLASPPAIGGSTPAAITGTTLTASSGAINPFYPNGITGSTSGSSPSSGSIGEHKSDTGSGVGLTNATATSVASISLEAGNWLVYGSGSFNNGGGSAASGLFVCINDSAAFPSIPYYAGLQYASNAEQDIPAPTRYFNVPSTTTYHLVMQANYAGGAMTGDAYIEAVRLP
jgi:hypothetical protein